MSQLQSTTNVNELQPIPLTLRQWWDGRIVTVGHLHPDGTFKARRKVYLQKPPAHAIDTGIATELARLGCKAVEITYLPTKTRYFIPFDEFQAHAFSISRGKAGAQLAVELRRFTVDSKINSRALGAGEAHFKAAKKQRHEQERLF